MSQTTLTILVSLLAVVIAAYSVYKAHQTGEPITLRGVESTLIKSEGTAQEIATVTKSAVFAAEQLKSTGKLPDNNAAFNYALSFAQKMLPDLDKATLTTFIESFVPLANQVYSSTQKPLPSPPQPFVPDPDHPYPGNVP